MVRTIEEAVAAFPWGRPHAHKRGRRAEWPYVPVVMHPLTHAATGAVVGERQEQIVRRAFATAPEAKAYAERVIEARKADFRRKLATLNYRALRAQWDVPESEVDPSLWDSPPQPAADQLEAASMKERG